PTALAELDARTRLVDEARDGLPCLRGDPSAVDELEGERRLKRGDAHARAAGAQACDRSERGHEDQQLFEFEVWHHPTSKPFDHGDYAGRRRCRRPGLQLAFTGRTS